jgi:HlyD family type I secretion membrane fusion protein
MTGTPTETRTDPSQPVRLGRIGDGGPDTSQTVALRKGARELAVADEAGRTSQLLLEYESPAAAQLAQPVPMRSRYTIYIIFTMFFSLFAVALLLPIDRVVAAAGQIVTVEPQTSVAALETGIVRSILVRPGQSVGKGDLLMTLDPTNATADKANYTEQVDALTQEIRRLEAELAGQIYLSDGSRHGDLQASLYTQRHAELTFQIESFNQQIAALTSQTNQGESDVRAYTDRFALASRVEDKRRELGRLGVGSELNTMSAADQRTEMQRALEAARAQLGQTRGSLASKTADRDAALQQWRATASQALKDQGDKLSQARDGLTRAQLALSMVELRAPFDATVLDIAPINTGAIATTGTQLMQLTPKASALEYEVLIDGANAGYVRPGQRVTIKYDTFPFVTHGSGTGRVRVLSPDASRQPFSSIQSPASLTSAQQAVGMLYYKARVSMETLGLFGIPPDFKPVPGMQVTADILIGRRTFIEYLFARVIPATNEAFREP